MYGDQPRPTRHAEIKEILTAKDERVVETRDVTDKYTVLGPEARRTFADWLTPIEEYFVCHRNDIPRVEADSWTVALTGQADGTLAMREIREEYPTVSVAATMECAGNGRGQHEPATGRVQWGYEAVGTAVWTGTPVAAILHDHEITAPDDLWLTAVGGDRPDQGDVFARSIPLSKALEDCVLAYEMNGQPLPREHGYPVRLIVPGWYGVNSVKWLAELRVMDHMVVDGSLERPGEHGFWQHDAYRIHPQGVEPDEHASVPTVDTWEQLEGAVEYPYTFDTNVKSLIGTPDGTAPVNPGDDGIVRVQGVAWAGDDAVARVEVSVDGGDSWADAELFGPEYPGAWRLFRYDWPAEPGKYVVVSRATDEHGRRQPVRISTPDAWREALERDEFPWNAGGYAANAYEPNAVEIEVTDSGG